jgi:hypothetical protein
MSDRWIERERASDRCRHPASKSHRRVRPAKAVRTASRSAGVQPASDVENAPPFNKARSRASVGGACRSPRENPTARRDRPRRRSTATTHRDYDCPPGWPRPRTASCSPRRDVASTMPARRRRLHGAVLDALASLTRLGCFWRDAGETPAVRHAALDALASLTRLGCSRRDAGEAPAVPGAALTPRLSLTRLGASWRDAGETPAVRHAALTAWFRIHGSRVFGAMPARRRRSDNEAGPGSL